MEAVFNNIILKKFNKFKKKYKFIGTCIETIDFTWHAHNYYDISDTGFEDLCYITINKKIIYNNETIFTYDEFNIIFLCISMENLFKYEFASILIYESILFKWIKKIIDFKYPSFNFAIFYYMYEKYYSDTYRRSDYFIFHFYLSKAKNNNIIFIQKYKRLLKICFVNNLLEFDSSTFKTNIIKYLGITNNIVQKYLNWSKYKEIWIILLCFH
jgi:hypothetical protein